MGSLQAIFVSPCLSLVNADLGVLAGGAGRSQGTPVSSMTFENQTTDADALRRRLGYQRWAVIGHSFGGHVALEYALRCPSSLSHLVLVDTGGDSRRSRHNAARPARQPRLQPGEGGTGPALVRRGVPAPPDAADPDPDRQRLLLPPSLSLVTRELIRGEWRSKMRPDALIFAGRHLLNGWTVMDPLSEITVPTLITSSRDDFIFPPEHRRELAAATPNARLHIIERAARNPHAEQPAEVMQAVRDFISA